MIPALPLSAVTLPMPGNCERIREDLPRPPTGTSHTWRRRLAAGPEGARPAAGSMGACGARALIRLPERAAAVQQGGASRRVRPGVEWKERLAYARSRLAKGQLPKPPTSALACSQERTKKAPPRRSNDQEPPSSKIGIRRQVRRNFAHQSPCDGTLTGVTPWGCAPCKHLN